MRLDGSIPSPRAGRVRRRPESRAGCRTSPPRPLALRTTSTHRARFPPSRPSSDPVLRVAKGDGSDATPGHAFGVSCASWYPVDTGMFFTGSFDGVVAGWDTNECRRVVSFDMTDKIYAVGMSPVATSHALVACGTSDPRVRLCDPASGNVTHTFAGHRDAVWAVEWTRGSEWILATGGCDGDIRVWDIRRAGAFMVLDASNARDAALDPLAQATTHAPDVPQFAGPAPPTRRNVDAVPDHLFTDAAVRCRGGGYGGGSRASGAYRGGTYGTARTRPAAARAAADGAPGSEEDPGSGRAAGTARKPASPFDRTRRERARTSAA